MLETIIMVAAGIGAALAAIFSAWRAGKSSGKNEEKVKHAQARSEELERIRRASDARPTGGVQDDPNNRDNR